MRSLWLVAGLCGLLLVFGAPVVAQRSTPPPTPLPLYALPDARQNLAFRSNTLALANDNQTLLVTNMVNDSVSIVALPQRAKFVEIPVGKDPRSIALTADNQFALVANRGDDTLTVLDVKGQKVASTITLGGLWPYGVVTDNNQMAYVSLQGSNEVVVVDIAAGQVMARIPVAAAPTGLALWGDFLYVSHFWTGQMSLIYLPQGRVISTVRPGLDTGLSPSIELDVSRGIAYLPQTRSNADNPALTYDTTVFPVINVIGLNDLSAQRIRRITVDTVDRPVNMPFSLALDRFRNILYVVNAGSNSVSAIDINGERTLAHIDVGSNPRGAVLNKDNSVLYVHNVLDNSISILDTRNYKVTDTPVIASQGKTPVDIIIAQQFFYTATDRRMSANGWLSCANCHFDGMSDGRVWRGFPDGPRRTPVLYDLSVTGPYNWSGTWDELADVEHKIRWLQAGSGLIDNEQANPPLGDPNAGRSVDLDLLTSYLSKLEGPQPPFAFDPAVVGRGQKVFEEQGCATCHAGSIGTDLQMHDVGTGESEKGGKAFDTPSLRWLWLSAPYFHDGSAATLQDVFMHGGAHSLVNKVSPEDISALSKYLLTLPAS
jgi:YVTN family beta-propeller protein